MWYKIALKKNKPSELFLLLLLDTGILQVNLHISWIDLWSHILLGYLIGDNEAKQGGDGKVHVPDVEGRVIFDPHLVDAHANRETS